MACPQTENGYTRIANEILERLSYAGINGSGYRILLVVIRKTYGFNKKKDKISLTQFEKTTQMNRKEVVETIKYLLSKHILLKEGNDYVFNKNYDEWVVGKRPPQWANAHYPSGQKPTRSSGQLPTHKRKKEIYTKEIGIAETSSAQIPDLIRLFEGVNPACKGYYANKTQRKACSDLITTYGFDEISRVIHFLPKNNSTPFKPKANTPFQLWEMYQSIKDAWIQEKNKLEAKRPRIVT